MSSQGWAASGTLMIACNCDYGCPCNVNGLPTTGKCEGGWTWTIDSGKYGSTSLDGLSISVFANWPGAIHEGGGKAVAFLDESGDDEQQEALRALIRGDAGGPWAIFSATYELDGPHAASYDVKIADEKSGYKIGDAADLQMRPITNPVTGDAVHPRLLLPEGLLVKDLGLYASETFAVRQGVEYDHSGRYAALGAFEYAGP
jgi:hypothetical protein